ncbi:hypothetical protein D3C77_559050 [compost metagenome]
MVSVFNTLLFASIDKAAARTCLVSCMSCARRASLTFHSAGKDFNTEPSFTAAAARKIGDSSASSWMID